MEEKNQKVAKDNKKLKKLASIGLITAVASSTLVAGGATFFNNQDVDSPLDSSYGSDKGSSFKSSTLIQGASFMDSTSTSTTNNTSTTDFDGWTDEQIRDFMKDAYNDPVFKALFDQWLKDKANQTPSSSTKIPLVMIKPAPTAAERQVMTKKIQQSIDQQIENGESILTQSFGNLVSPETIAKAKEQIKEKIANSDVINEVLSHSIDAIGNPEVAVDQANIISQEIQKILHDTISTNLLNEIEGRLNDASENELINKLKDNNIDVSSIIKDNSELIDKMQKEADALIKSLSDGIKPGELDLASLTQLASQLLSNNSINKFLDFKNLLPKLHNSQNLIQKIGLLTATGISGLSGLVFAVAGVRSVKSSSKSGVVYFSKKSMVILILALALITLAACAGALSYLVFMGGLI